MANLSHDLRTPITAVKGYVEGIRDGVANTPEKQAHYLDVVYAKTLVLEGLVGNMRDFSEYELGRMQYHFEYVELAPFLEDICPEYEGDAAGRDMTFTLRPLAGTVTVTADRGKLKRVLDNLVSNALKYGKPGGTVVLTGEPQRGVALHALIAGQNVLKRRIQRVTHVKLPRNVGRGHDDGEGLFLFVPYSTEPAALFPEVIDPRFHGMGIIHFRQFFHGTSSR